MLTKYNDYTNMSNKETTHPSDGKEGEMKAKTIRLPMELMEALRREADEKGMSVNNVMLFILWRSIAQ